MSSVGEATWSLCVTSSRQGAGRYRLSPIMNTARLNTLRLGVLLAAALLVAEAGWSLQLAADDHSVFHGAFAVGALVGALGLLQRRAWSRLAVYGATALLLVTCTYYIGSAALLGEFDALPMSFVGASLARVLTLCVLSISSAEVVRRYFRAVSGLPAAELRQERFVVTRGPRAITN